MSESTAVDKRLPVAGLSFRIEGGEPAILRYHGDGCRPATGPEVELWNALTARDKLLADLRESIVWAPVNGDTKWKGELIRKIDGNTEAPK
jgi:hypothetical protein